MTLHSSIVLKGLNAAAKASELVSQARLWTKILRWIGLESTVLVMCSMIDGVFDVASLRIEISWSLPNGSRSFLILSRFVSLSSSASSSSTSTSSGSDSTCSSSSSDSSAGGGGGWSLSNLGLEEEEDSLALEADLRFFTGLLEIGLVTLFMGLFLGFIFCFFGFDGGWVWLLELDLGFVRN